MSKPTDFPFGYNAIVIGAYADYYAEHDGMVEIGPGCSERLQARIDRMQNAYDCTPNENKEPECPPQ